MTLQSEDMGKLVAKAVEAMTGAIQWDKERGYRMPYRVRDPLYAAIDAFRPAHREAQPETDGGGEAGDWQAIAAWMGFAAAAIKFGQPWTDQCQREFDEAKRAFARLNAPTPEGQTEGWLDPESGEARTKVVNIIERYVTGWGGEYEDNPYDAAPHIIREILAALASKGV